MCAESLDNVFSEWCLESQRALDFLERVFIQSLLRGPKCALPLLVFQSRYLVMLSVFWKRVLSVHHIVYNYLESAFIGVYNLLAGGGLKRVPYLVESCRVSVQWCLYSLVELSKYLFICSVTRCVYMQLMALWSSNVSNLLELRCVYYYYLDIVRYVVYTYWVVFIVFQGRFVYMRFQKIL